ncbi:hypothetical protein WN944_025945 [Citrus x changshan-huyou]|uniref:Agenet domain-containing protein n=1 Tax=Citrus x changshan-huyou TaxID=2935761 RepID=A0AAP0LQR9_9ROSI
MGSKMMDQIGLTRPVKEIQFETDPFGKDFVKSNTDKSTERSHFYESGVISEIPAVRFQKLYAPAEYHHVASQTHSTFIHIRLDLFGIRINVDIGVQREGTSRVLFAFKGGLVSWELFTASWIIMGKSRLPFKVGQLTESRSFVPGFRSSWFRCKIRNISVRHKEVMHALEYLDFPDEKIRWTKLYQKPVGGSRSKEMKRQIMVRPSFPPIFCESQMPDVNNITEVVVIVNDVWKVGDLVDWWTDNCYWTGRLTEILGDGKARIELLPPPVGEGLSYEVFLKDLRPTLEWSLDNGWTVPTSIMILFLCGLDTLYSNVDTMYLTLYSNVDTMYLFSLLVGNDYLLKEKESSYCARIIKPLNPVNQGRSAARCTMSLLVV